MSGRARENRVIYLLVEDSDREFRARCIMAVIAARQGYDVVIGPQWLIWEQLDKLAPGVMLFKGNNKIQVANMHFAKQAGHLIASIEEEVLGVADEKEIQRHYASGVSSVCDLFLVQGRFQAECLVKQDLSYADRTAIVGNPRTDLLRDPFTENLHKGAERLRARYGEFVLLNTNYGGINPAHGDSLTFYNRSVLVGMSDRDNPSELSYFMDRLRWERDNAKAIIQFAHGLAARRPGTRIILRPHPAERLERWSYYLGPASPITLIREGDHLPWTFASKAMVHTGCTTGLEAAILGAPSLSLMPGDNPLHASMISNVANPVARTVGEALDRVISHLDGGGGSSLEDIRDLDFSYYLDFVSGMLSSHRAVDALIRLHANLDTKTAANTQIIGSSKISLLENWQSNKYTITIESARKSILEVTKEIGYSEVPDVNAIYGGSIIVQARNITSRSNV
jgi:surface carbohydrate biosynthesis protein